MKVAFSKQNTKGRRGEDTKGKGKDYNMYGV